MTGIVKNWMLGCALLALLCVAYAGHHKENRVVAQLHNKNARAYKQFNGTHYQTWYRNNVYFAGRTTSQQSASDLVFVVQQALAPSTIIAFSADCDYAGHRLSVNIPCDSCDNMATVAMVLEQGDAGDAESINQLEPTLPGGYPVPQSLAQAYPLYPDTKDVIYADIDIVRDLNQIGHFKFDSYGSPTWRNFYLDPNGEIRFHFAYAYPPDQQVWLSYFDVRCVLGWTYAFPQ